VERPDYQYPYRPTDGRENPDAGEEVRRVLRGGAFFGFHSHVRCAYRYRLPPYDRNFGVGFRVGVLPAS
jgi:formylglycine-generating enzyme required for sulfatase activity